LRYDAGAAPDGRLACPVLRTAIHDHDLCRDPEIGDHLSERRKKHFEILPLIPRRNDHCQLRPIPDAFDGFVHRTVPRVARSRRTKAQARQATPRIFPAARRERGP
jgi:hypothetical protein